MKTQVAVWGGLLLAVALPGGYLNGAELGERAAPLEIAEWVKGGPVDLAAGKGKTVYVVEFWATWCPPCRTSIPHLTEIQKRFKDQGVVVVGVTDEKLTVVKPFVDKLGDKMDYVVAVDRARKTSEGYMKAYGQGGIPHAFVVDKEGNVVWHGHPMSGLDKTLAALVAGKYDLAMARKQGEAEKLFAEYWKIAADEAAKDRAAELEGKLKALDDELGGFMGERRFNPVEVKQQIRFSAAMQEFQRAVIQERPETEVLDLEKKAEALAPAEVRFAEMKEGLRLQVAFRQYMQQVQAEAPDETKLAEVKRKLDPAQVKNPVMLNEMAWTILTDERVKKRDLELALRMAKTAVGLSQAKDASILDTYARALFDSGKVTEAIAQQKLALAVCEEAELKAGLQETLRRYEAKEAGR